MRSLPSPMRSRTRGHRTATAPMPVMISRSGRCPWRTSRRQPSSVNLSVWVLSQAATSASTARPNSVLAPLRKTSVSGSENVPGWVSSKTLVSVTAYRSFGGEVEALNTPTIRRLTLSRRHQLSALALSPPVRFAKDIADLRPFIRDSQAILEEAYVRREHVLLEGTQGTSLSLHHGLYPHVTSRETSVAGCLADAGVSPSRVRKVIIVCRT